MAMGRLASMKYVVTPSSPLVHSKTYVPCTVQASMETHNGMSPQHTFSSPHIYQQQWRQMFDAFDVDRDGRIDASELSKALDHYKYASPLISWFSPTHAFRSRQDTPSANLSSTC